MVYNKARQGGAHPTTSFPLSATQAVAPTFIRSLRTKLGLSQAALARRLGVARFTVTRWETGRSTPHRVFVLMLRELDLDDEQRQ